MPDQKAFIIATLLVLASCFFMQHSLYSQEFIYNKFSEEEGLPSNDVYDVHLASDGLMWFATDNGVSRFDGNSFTNYNVSNGLPTNSVLKIYEDHEGRLWFLAYNGMLSYYEKGELITYEYNDTLVKYFHDNYFNKIYIDSCSGILLSPRHGSYGYISSEGRLSTRDELIPTRVDSCYLSVEDKGEEYFLTILREIPVRCERNGRLSFFDSTYYLKVRFTPREFQRNYIDLGKDEFLVSYRSCVYYIKDKYMRCMKEFEDEVLSLFIDDQHKLWVSVKYDQGLYMFEDLSFNKEGTHFFDGYTITSVTQDREGDYWLGTEGYGVFFLPSFEFNLYTLPWDDRNLNVMALEVSGDRLWFSSRDKHIYGGRLAKGVISDIRKIDIQEPYDWIKHICIDSEGYLWLSSTQSIRYDPAGFPRPPDTVLSSTFIEKGLGDTMIVASKRLGIFHGTKLVYTAEPDSTRRLYSAYHDKNNDLWLGTLYGLYTLVDDNFHYRGDMSPYLKERISCIDKLGEMLVIGTSAHGLLFLRKDTVAYHLQTSNGLIGNSIKSIFIQNDTILWVGTKSGLNKISFVPDYDNYNIESYGQGDGLPSSEINSISMHDGYIWLATGRGLVSFDPDALKPHLAPPLIRVTGIQIGGRDTCLLESYTLSSDQNDIRISFSGVSYRTEEGLRYRYMLSNYNDEIIQTKNEWANFPNLPPGEYSFFLNVGNIHGIWNEAPVQIDFTITKHFTQTVWFILMLILITAVPVVLITMFFQRQKKIKENARVELIKLEQKLFQLQMNPHFVFNALLAIQGYMYMNKPREAGRYLTSFAKLIRHTLYGSSEEYISLDKELEALQYYMELQRLRFDEHFEFIIELDDDLIVESLLIPPLLLQPFLENAIEHGLQHREKNGLLKLKMIMAEECLIVEVEDNGIGREESEKMQRGKGKLHKSMGLEIVRKRVDSLNKIMLNKINMDIVDLYDDDGKSRGTLVKLCIPYKSS